MSLPRIRFTVLGLLLITTVVALAFASASSPMLMAVVVGPMVASTIVGCVVLDFALFRIIWIAIRNRDWAPIRKFLSWAGLFIVCVILEAHYLLYRSLTLPSELPESSYRAIAQWMRILGIVIGLALSAYFVTSKRIWRDVRSDDARE